MISRSWQVLLTVPPKSIRRICLVLLLIPIFGLLPTEGRKTGQVLLFALILFTPIILVQLSYRFYANRKYVLDIITGRLSLCSGSIQKIEKEDDKRRYSIAVMAADGPVTLRVYGPLRRLYGDIGKISDVSIWYLSRSGIIVSGYQETDAPAAPPADSNPAYAGMPDTVRRYCKQSIFQVLIRIERVYIVIVCFLSFPLAGMLTSIISNTLPTFLILFTILLTVSIFLTLLLYRHKAGQYLYAIRRISSDSLQYDADITHNSLAAYTKGLGCPQIHKVYRYITVGVGERKHRFLYLSTNHDLQSDIEKAANAANGSQIQLYYFSYYEHATRSYPQVLVHSDLVEHQQSHEPEPDRHDWLPRYGDQVRGYTQMITRGLSKVLVIILVAFLALFIPANIFLPDEDSVLKWITVSIVCLYAVMFFLIIFGAPVFHVKRAKKRLYTKSGILFDVTDFIMTGNAPPGWRNTYFPPRRWLADGSRLYILMNREYYISNLKRWKKYKDFRGDLFSRQHLDFVLTESSLINKADHYCKTNDVNGEILCMSDEVEVLYTMGPVPIMLDILE